MGRLLKLLAFTHGEAIAVRTLTGSNVLLVPDRHFALVFDWSSAMTYPEFIPRAVQTDEVAHAAKAVFAAIGGDPQTGHYPYLRDGDDESRQYVDFLWRLASGRVSTAEKAHTQFYELVDALYGKKFHPFTTLPL